MLKSILQTATWDKGSPTLPTDLSILRDKTSWRLITTPAEVIMKLAKMKMLALSPIPILPHGPPLSWFDRVRSTPTYSVPMISGHISPAIMQKTLRRTPNHKAAGPYGVSCLVLKHMSPTCHETLYLLFQTLVITGITLPSEFKSHTFLLYKKGDPTWLDNESTMTLAIALYKLWTTYMVTLAINTIEFRKILSPEKKGFRADCSCARAVTHRRSPVAALDREAKKLAMSREAT
jgi:hypothetical protein